MAKATIEISVESREVDKDHSMTVVRCERKGDDLSKLDPASRAVFDLLWRESEKTVKAATKALGDTLEACGNLDKITVAHGKDAVAAVEKSEGL